MSTLRIQLLSNFQLVHNGVPVTTINQARMQALLAYLVLHRDAMVARQQLAFLFWPDTSEAQAQTNLRQLLHHLRRAWPAVGEFVQIEARHLQWKPAVICQIDLQLFEAALVQATTALQGKQLDAARTALSEAVAVYTGDLLPACYEEWLLLERERLRQRFLQALAQVVALYEGERNYPLAIHHAQRLLQADPLQEATYQRLMQLYALHGDRTGALRTYQSCVAVLRRELDVAPNAALQALYARLVKLEQPLAPPSRRANPQERLIGRQAAWAKLQAAWQTTLGGQTHFVCISGEAGIGKTRLAEELLTWARQQGITTAHSRSYAAEGELAYVPVIEWLRSAVLQSTLLHLDAVWRTELARLLPE